MADKGRILDALAILSGAAAGAGIAFTIATILYHLALLMRR